MHFFTLPAFPACVTVTLPSDVTTIEPIPAPLKPPLLVSSTLHGFDACDVVRSGARTALRRAVCASATDAIRSTKITLKGSVSWPKSYTV